MKSIPSECIPSIDSNIRTLLEQERVGNMGSG